MNEQPAVLTERRERVLLITINRPDARNAVNAAVATGIAAAMDELDTDGELTLGILTGAGTGFCAGMDLKAFVAGESAWAGDRGFAGITQRGSVKPLIAAIEGFAVAGGLEIALACDIRIAKRGGGNVGLPEVTLGVLPGTGGTQRLARALPKNKAIELMTEGKLISFEESLALGLINYIYEPENYWDEVMKYAKSFCPPNKASKAVGRIKRAVQSGPEVAFSEALAIERELQQILFQSDDAKEGIAAYVSKPRRTAEFTGR